jgi:predicted TPR repeat methyltransferase
LLIGWLAAAHFRLGVVREKQGDLGAAGAHYRDALAADPALTAAARALARTESADRDSD